MMKIAPATIVAVPLVAFLFLIGGEFAGPPDRLKAWAQVPGQPGNQASINRYLPDMQSGVLTRFASRAVQIDGATYQLAPGCVVALENGLPVPPEFLQRPSLHLRVVYWLGSEEPTKGQVIQLLIKRFS